MDNYTIQTLITQGRVVSSGDVDPNNTYVQIGVWQPGNRKRNASNDAYPSYVIPLSEIAPQQVIDVLGSTLYSTNPPAGPNFSTSNGIFFGQNSGQNAFNSFNSVFLGYLSGRFSSNSYYSNFIGTEAGRNSSSLYYTNIIGQFSGTTSIGNYYSNIIGAFAGSDSSNSNRNISIGTYAGSISNASPFSVFIGTQAGYEHSQATASVFIGSLSGWGGSYPFNFAGPVGRRAFGCAFSTFIGDSSGIGADQATNTVGIGYQAGAGLGGVPSAKVGGGSNNIYLGTQTATFAAQNGTTNIIGYRAGIYSSNLNNVDAIGRDSVFGASVISNSIFLGNRSGVSANNLSESIFIGSSAGESSTSSYVIGLGRNAGFTNPVSNAFIINNNYIPVCVNEAAANTYYNLAPAGNTYLYWDSTNGKLEAIRK